LAIENPIKEQIKQNRSFLIQKEIRPNKNRVYGYIGGDEPSFYMEIDFWVAGFIQGVKTQKNDHVN